MDRRSFVKNADSVSAPFLLRKDWLTVFMQENPYKMKMLRNDVGIFTEKGGTTIDIEILLLWMPNFPSNPNTSLMPCKKTGQTL
jgi:hypothetical protein